ncbi:methyltransferase domain-containing protein [Frigidibacter albus]|uniref:Methyltransferase domain-containing protein n=1 Tax=Frigidibacter albus TaxID=1465486 RepID=A0A6L8VDF1_9RHOB|nr:class I SAM-dependent methyltransferase [Frigidibacter albus]MZQ87751.1 methyltransferase domain-containing protein [Frigidibacter albus]NBE29657.1 methyltransferase domain-containing protein [Frigidibacter albus]GGH43529.1 hypothetical protein GCM10011341_02260 [Frigidibacter albus]
MTAGDRGAGAAAPLEVVDDELGLMRRLLPLEGARILDVGCGDGGFARRLVSEAGAARVVGIDLPETLGPASEGVELLAGKAEALPVADGAFDVVAMMKSLHHVAPDRMDRALLEAARVLRMGGLLYVSEPVARGPFDAIMRIFHDEAEVRSLAQAALTRFTGLERQRRLAFLSPIRFGSFEEFKRRMMHLPTLTAPITADMHAAARAAYRAQSTKTGVFAALREVQVAVFQKP